VLQSSVREWSRRIAETTLMLQPLDAAERGGAIAALQARGPGYGPRHRPPPAGARAARAALRAFLRLPMLSDFEQTLKQQLRTALGPAYGVDISPTREPPPPAAP